MTYRNGLSKRSDDPGLPGIFTEYLVSSAFSINVHLLHLCKFSSLHGFNGPADKHDVGLHEIGCTI